MPRKTWRTEFDGQTIEVVDERHLTPPDFREQLWIAGVLVVENRYSEVSFQASLQSELTKSDGSESQITALLGPKYFGLAIGAQIFADGEFIGGDRRLQLTSPEEIEAVLSEGFWRYLLRRGLWIYGLPSAALILLVVSLFGIFTIGTMIVLAVAAGSLVGIGFTALWFSALRHSRIK